MNIGDSVEILNSTSNGIITGFTTDGRVIVNVDEVDMEITYPVQEVIVLTNKALAQSRILSSSYIETKSPCDKHKSQKIHSIQEIDLHAEKLPTYIRQYRVKSVLECQIKYFLQVLKENMNKKGKRFVFICGKGAGILRDAMIRELNKHQNLYHYSAANSLYYDYHSALEVVIL